MIVNIAPLLLDLSRGLGLGSWSPFDIFRRLGDLGVINMVMVGEAIFIREGYNFIATFTVPGRGLVKN